MVDSYHTEDTLTYRLFSLFTIEIICILYLVLYLGCFKQDSVVQHSNETDQLMSS